MLQQNHPKNPPPPANANIAEAHIVITDRARSLADGLATLNRQLSEVRGKLYGDEDACPPECPARQAPPLRFSIDEALREMETAHDQVGSILSRL